jgi:tetratricopeptide (TPR) repeat protein
VSTVGAANRRLAGGPYVGPRPFRAADADRFFGRHREALDIRSIWPAERVVVLHGPAGVGKTSLLNAGILPLLVSGEEIDLLPIGRLVHQPARPVATDRADNGYRYTLLSSWAPFGEPPGPNTTVQEFLAARPRLTNTRGEPFSVLAAIDQFEELFTSFPARDDQTEQLIDELAEAVRETEAFSLLLIVRDDHLATLSRYEGRLSPYPVVYRRLEALDAEAAAEAVTEPLARTRRSFAPEAVDSLIERLRTFRYTDRLLHTVTLKHDRIEPLDLQIACANLWSSLPDDVDVITDANLRAFGDPGQAAADFYDTAVRDVCQLTQHAEVYETELREWIESVFITERGTRGTALRGITTTADMPNSVADAFADLRILTPEYRNQSTWYQLGQDRLIGAVRRGNRAWRAARGMDAAEPQPARTAADFRAAAEAAFGTGDFAGAQRLIVMALAGYRNDEDPRGLAHTLEFQGEVARVEGDLSAAERSFRDALDGFSALEDTAAQVRLLSALGDIYSAVGDYAKAVQFHQQASQRLPADVDALTGLGYAQWYWGSPADAEATFTRALGWNRNKGRALAGRGQVRVELRQYPAALADLDRAITLGLPLDNEIDARSARAVVLADLGREDEADRELRAARFQDPERSRTRLRAGRVAATLGRAARARDELEHALRARPPLPPRDEDIARRLLAELSDTA